MTELDECINSRRCFGVTCKAVGATLKQATPLKVSQLLYLHKRQITDTDVWNRLFIGALFFGLYGRGRWSDCQHGEAFIVDRDEEQNLVFIEVQAGVHKNSESSSSALCFFCQWWRLVKAWTAGTGANSGSRTASFFDAMT